MVDVQQLVSGDERPHLDQLAGPGVRVPPAHQNPGPFRLPGDAMTTSAAPRWRRLEPDERREQILACAIKLFGERPYSAVSTTELAQEAGVARGLINHYFGTKRDLYLEVVRQMVTFPEYAFKDLPEGSLDERVDGAVSWFLDLISHHPKTWLAVIGAEGIGDDPEVERIL